MNRPVICYRKCPTCETEFPVTSRNPKQRYCSVICWTTSKESKEAVSKAQVIRHTKWRREDIYYPTKKRIYKVCPVCHEEFEVQPSRDYQECCSVICGSKKRNNLLKRDERMRFIKGEK